MIKKILKKSLKKIGYEIKKIEPVSIYPDDFEDFYKKCKPYTMTNKHRLFGVYEACIYVAKNNIPGAFVECGVWRGGSSMMACLTLLKYGNGKTPIFLYDTFAGMSEPTPEDKRIDGSDAKEKFELSQKGEINEWCYASLDDVKANIALTKYPSHLVTYVVGKVEDTLPGTLPNEISVLRLDTDWYKSTQQEMEHLYPLVHKHGALILDDYGHWLGAKQAVDEYFDKIGFYPMMIKLDYSARLVLPIWKKE